jgi:hypothetical protein
MGGSEDDEPTSNRLYYHGVFGQSLNGVGNVRYGYLIYNRVKHQNV